MKERAVSREIAIKNAEFSLRMEGFSIDSECRTLCEKLLKKEITFDDYLKEIGKKQGLKV